MAWRQSQNEKLRKINESLDMLECFGDNQGISDKVRAIKDGKLKIEDFGQRKRSRMVLTPKTGSRHAKSTKHMNANMDIRSQLDANRILSESFLEALHE